MVAYLEKTDGNAEFHEIIDFLTRSSIHYALTVSPVVSTTFVEQFWMTAKSKTINNVRYITATVAGKPVSISEASIRSDLQFNDAAGIDVLPNQAIFDTIQLMGYEGDLNTLTFNKGLFSPQWKFLFHTIIHCLSSKSTSWDQIPTNIATAVICLATNQVYNFSKLFFDGMMRHLDAKKKFVMYPRFILVFLTNQLKNVPVPLDHFPINALTTKVFSFMVKKEDEGEVSERPSETQPTPSPTHPSTDKSEPQSDPSLRPSSSNSILDSIPEASSGNHGGQSSSDRSLSGNEDGLTPQSAQIKKLKKKAKPVISHHNAWIKSVSMKKRLARKKSLKTKLMKKESVSKQGRKPAKSEPTVHKDLAFDDLDDAIDYIETEDAHDEGTVKDGEKARVQNLERSSTNTGCKAKKLAEENEQERQLVWIKEEEFSEEPESTDRKNPEEKKRINLWKFQGTELIREVKVDQRPFHLSEDDKLFDRMDLDEIPRVYRGRTYSLKGDEFLRKKKISLHRIQALLEQDGVYGVYEIHSLPLYANGVDTSLVAAASGQPELDQLLGRFDSLFRRGAGMDLKKVKFVHEWPEPTTQRHVRGFLGLTGYYRHFIRGYATLAAPLTDLL
ncbi:hypothetical protein Tco_0586651 [Tanacetum coccineum]